MKLKRSRRCGEIRGIDAGTEVILSGWVDRWRDHGGVVFIDLRDRWGVLQVVFDPNEVNIPEANTLRVETVVTIKGQVRLRPDGMHNAGLPTGDIEVLVTELEILNRAEPLPYSLHEDSPTAGEVQEKLRLKYRYLELRKPRQQRALILRHQFLKSAREHYFANDFIEIETPILYKTTPEGARDYLVPSRVHPGKFYALPQSPQTLKQLCMIGGFDRYVQIARCFRDEDLRADRQPEFTQVDVEMSFVGVDDVLQIHEGLMQKCWKDVLNVEVSTPFRRMDYPEAMAQYGSDKPDMRNSLQMVTLTEQGKRSSFQVYKTVLDNGGILKGFAFEEKEPLSRSELDGLLKKVKPYGAQGITWIRIKGPGDWQSPQAKFFDEALKAEIESLLPAHYEKGTPSYPLMVLLLCGSETVVNNGLSHLRLEFGERFGYSSKDTYEFLWVTNFPLLQFNEEDGRFYAAHHPFTNPHPEDREKFMSVKAQYPLSAEAIATLKSVRASAYDLVCNGYEIGGGSLRIYDSNVQAQMFRVLGMSEEEAQSKFGFFLEALKYGTPPHGGIALGVDRIAMILCGSDAIRDVIAFPKTQTASDVMAEAPSFADEHQLKELSIKVIPTD